jgi:uncharacterized DUF497 family protein
LFEEALKLDPEERALLMRLLIESMDAESEDHIISMRKATRREREIYFESIAN